MSKLKKFLYSAVFILGIQSGDAVKSSGRVIELRFEQCHDGDTCKARNAAGALMTLRFVGIDAPEVASFHGKSHNPGQIYGPEAREYLRARVLGQSLPVKILGSDVYHRYLAIVYDAKKITDAESINAELIAKGFAYAYRGRSQNADIKEWATRAERVAIKNKAGFWALTKRPEEPQLYRRQNR